MTDQWPCFLSPEAKYRLLRQQLKAAIVTQDQALLEQAVREFEANDVPDTFGELEKAKKLLLFIKVTEGKALLYINSKAI